VQTAELLNKVPHVLSVLYGRSHPTVYRHSRIGTEHHNEEVIVGDNVPNDIYLSKSDGLQAPQLVLKISSAILLIGLSRHDGVDGLTKYVGSNISCELEYNPPANPLDIYTTCMTAADLSAPHPLYLVRTCFSFFGL
jgi:hypothetical protein